MFWWSINMFKTKWGWKNERYEVKQTKNNVRAEIWIQISGLLVLGKDPWSVNGRNPSPNQLTRYFVQISALTCSWLSIVYCSEQTKCISKTDTRTHCLNSQTVSLIQIQWPIHQNSPSVYPGQIQWVIVLNSSSVCPRQKMTHCTDTMTHCSKQSKC